MVPYAASSTPRGLSESRARAHALWHRRDRIGPCAITPDLGQAEAIAIVPTKLAYYLRSSASGDDARDRRKGCPPSGRGFGSRLTVAAPRVRYEIGPDRLQRLISRILPKRLLDRLVARRLGLTRKGG